MAHIVHHMKMGGVENAARYYSMNATSPYKVFCLGGGDEQYLANLDDKAVIFRKKGEHLLAYTLRFLSEYRAFMPDLLITSLWRSHFVGLLFKLFVRERWVPFFHSVETFHFADRLSRSLALKVSKTAFSDSGSTKKSLLSQHKSLNVETISFLFFEEAAVVPFADRSFRAVFLGRLAEVKNLPYLIEVFAEVNKSEQLVLDVYGDGADREKLQYLVRAKGLERIINFKGAVEAEEVGSLLQEYKFFVQSSVAEGMAVSVTQALLAGCCCMVSFVGEIATFCRHGHNAVELKLGDVKTASDAVKCLINNEAACKKIAGNASHTFDDSEGYVRSFSDACMREFSANYKSMP